MTIKELMLNYDERIKFLNHLIKAKEEENPEEPLWFSRGQVIALTQVLTDLEILRQHYDI